MFSVIVQGGLVVLQYVTLQPNVPLWSVCLCFFFLSSFLSSASVPFIPHHLILNSRSWGTCCRWTGPWAATCLLPPSSSWCPMGLWLLSSRKYHPLSLLGSTQTQTRSVTVLPFPCFCHTTLWSLSQAVPVEQVRAILSPALVPVQAADFATIFSCLLSASRDKIHFCLKFLRWAQAGLIPSSQFLGCYCAKRTLEFYVQFSVALQLRVFARGSIPSSSWFIVVKMPKTCLKQSFWRKVSCDQILEITWHLEQK